VYVRNWYRQELGKEVPAKRETFFYKVHSEIEPIAVWPSQKFDWKNFKMMWNLKSWIALPYPVYEKRMTMKGVRNCRKIKRLFKKYALN